MHFNKHKEIESFEKEEKLVTKNGIWIIKIHNGPITTIQRGKLIFRDNRDWPIKTLTINQLKVKLPTQNAQLVGKWVYKIYSHDATWLSLVVGCKHNIVFYTKNVPDFRCNLVGRETFSIFRSRRERERKWSFQKSEKDENYYFIFQWNGFYIFDKYFFITEVQLCRDGLSLVWDNNCIKIKLCKQNKLKCANHKLFILCNNKMCVSMFK